MQIEKIVHEIDKQLSHVWMVRTFLKHSEEAEEDDELNEVHRGLYDFAHALGPALESGDWTLYLRMAKKKIKKLRAATELFEQIQPEISSHTNFKMAAVSLRVACDVISELLSQFLVASQSSTVEGTKNKT